MKKSYLTLGILLLVGFQTAHLRDDRADAVANKVFESMGGKTTWSNVHYLGFQFGSARNGQRSPAIKHLWDRFTGDYRVEWKKSADTSVVVLFNVNTKQGNAFYRVGANEPTKADAALQATLLSRAYTRYINDTYWLLMPLKMLDNGVNRSYAADSSTVTHDVVNLSFENVGLTPKDRYWVFVNKSTGLVDKWAYILQSNRDGKATVWEWTDYQSYPTSAGEVKLANRKVNKASGADLFTDQIEFPASVAPDAFTKP